MDAAESRYQFDPHPAIGLEFGEFTQRDFVSQVTSDHRPMLRRAANRARIDSLAGRDGHAEFRWIQSGSAKPRAS
jgi:hypothetical protein